MKGDGVARRRIAATLILVSTFAVAGCRVKNPPTRDKVQRDALPNVTLTEPWKARAPLAGAVPDDWLASFNDPQLTALVNEAVANNPDLRVTAARVEQSAEYVKIAKAKLYPAVNFAGRRSTKLGADLGTGLSGAILSASWELDLWGRVRYARNATAEDYASALADQEYARQSIAAATANAWFMATETLRQRELAEQLVEFSKQLVAIAEKRQQVGVGEEQDVALARANQSLYEDSLVQIRAAHDDALRAVEQLLGRYPAAELQARLDLPRLPGPVPAGIPLEMLERRPDLFAAERRVAAAFNRIGEARAARLPQLSLTGTTGAITSETIKLKSSFSNPIGGLTASLLAPIFNAGALKAQVEIRTLQQKEAVAEYARLALRAIDDVESTLAAEQTLTEREEILQLAVVQNERALALEQVSYRVGKIDLRPVLQQQLTVYGARVALYRVQSERLIQRVNLNLALGVRYAP
jgi:NodT family efflux transporter outer membrane factor (OMF) lipoprotein